MKKIYLVCIYLFVFTSIRSQIKNPINWVINYRSISSSEGEIIIVANIEKGWHTYSQKPTDAGPVPTSFTFKTSKNYQLIDKPLETGAHQEFVKAFDATIFVFTNKAEFKQKIKINTKNTFNIDFKIEYMSCNDQMCLPPKIVENSIKIQ